MAHPSLASNSLHLVLRGIQGGVDANGPSAASTPEGPNVDAWTRGVLASLGVASDARGTGGAPLGIELDGARPAKAAFAPDHAAADDDRLPVRRPPARRDSQRRREALLKGKEGSRQRRRWENDHLLHVPNAQPPLPSDWEVRPTHPVRNGLPYHLAQYWDKGLRQQVNETRAAAAVLRRQQTVAHDAKTAVTAVTAARVGTVTRELRATAKKTPAVKTWVRTLEEPVRAFAVAAAAAAARAAGDDPVDTDWSSASSDAPCFEDDSEDEIVFVGRKTPKQPPSPADAGIVLDALGTDRDGSFQRWLTHSISDYYGLASHSITVGSPSRRAVYVTLPGEIRAPGVALLVPRPMWELF